MITNKMRMIRCDFISQSDARIHIAVNLYLKVGRFMEEFFGRPDLPRVATHHQKSLCCPPRRRRRKVVTKRHIPRVQRCGIGRKKSNHNND